MKAVLFDLDGTRIDSSEGIIKSVLYTLKHYGMKEDNIEGLKAFIGPPLFMSFMSHYGFPKDKAVEAVDVYRERYNKIGKYECRLYPNVRECIVELKKNGYLIALASSKPEVSCRDILKHFDILDLFDEVVGATFDGRIDTKEEVLNELMRRWKAIPKDEMCLIGDTIFDIEGANKVGIKSFGVSFGFGNVKEMKEAGEIEIFDDMLEIPEAIRVYEDKL